MKKISHPVVWGGGVKCRRYEWLNPSQDVPTDRVYIDGLLLFKELDISVVIDLLNNKPVILLNLGSFSWLD